MKSVQQLINPALARQSRQFDYLRDLLLACLPQNCHDHLSIANIHHKQLVLVTDSPVWASRLRLYTNTMLDMLKKHSETDINHIKVRQIQERLTIKPGVKKIQRQMGTDAGQLIAQTASYIEDNDLQNALLKLSKRAGT